MAKAKEKGQWSAGIALEKDIRLFSVPRPRAQGKQEPAQPVAIAEARATTRAHARARAAASTLQRAKAKEARLTSQEARDGAKPRAKEEARAMARAMAKEKARSQTWMKQAGPMWAPAQETGIGQQAPSGQQLRPTPVGPLQQLGLRSPMSPRLLGWRRHSQRSRPGLLSGLAPREPQQPRPG